MIGKKGPNLQQTNLTSKTYESYSFSLQILVLFDHETVANKQKYHFDLTIIVGLLFGNAHKKCKVQCDLGQCSGTLARTRKNLAKTL